MSIPSRPHDLRSLLVFKATTFLAPLVLDSRRIPIVPVLVLRPET